MASTSNRIQKRGNSTVFFDDRECHTRGTRCTMPLSIFLTATGRHIIR